MILFQNFQTLITIDQDDLKHRADLEKIQQKVLIVTINIYVTIYILFCKKKHKISILSLLLKREVYI